MSGSLIKQQKRLIRQYGFIDQQCDLLANCPNLLANTRISWLSKSPWSTAQNRSKRSEGTFYNVAEGWKHKFEVEDFSCDTHEDNLETKTRLVIR